jgi:hypothetical protein
MSAGHMAFSQLGQIGRRFRSGAVRPLGSLRSKFLSRVAGNIAAWGLFNLVARFGGLAEQLLRWCGLEMSGRLPANRAPILLIALMFPSPSTFSSICSDSPKLQAPRLSLSDACNIWSF